MQHTFALQIASTGETIKTGASHRSMLVWQRATERKLLKLKGRREAVKTAIKTGDTAVAWISYDNYHKGCTLEELKKECSRVFRGLNKDT